MNTERNDQTKAVYYVWLELQKLILWPREIPSEILLSSRPYVVNNDETFGKLL